MQTVHGMFFNLIFFFFFNIYNYLKQKKNMLQTELTCSLRSFQKCYINKTHIYKYLFFINI